MNEARETIRIVNPVQAGRYVEGGLEPLKIYWHINKWVWEFDKQGTKPLWYKWLNKIEI